MEHLTPRGRRSLRRRRRPPHHDPSEDEVATAIHVVRRVLQNYVDEPRMIFTLPVDVATFTLGAFDALMEWGVPRYSIYRAVGIPAGVIGGLMYVVRNIARRNTPQLDPNPLYPRWYDTPEEKSTPDLEKMQRREDVVTAGQTVLFADEEKTEVKDMLGVTNPIVKLRDINLNRFGKGGRKGDYWDRNLVIMEKTYDFRGAGVYDSIKNSKAFFPVPEIVTNTPNASSVALSRLNATYNECQINSVQQLEYVAQDLSSSTDENWLAGADSVSKTYANPIYSTTAPYFCESQRDAGTLIGLENQFIYLRFKNNSANATEDEEIKTTTPVMTKIYVMQAKDDIYSEYVFGPHNFFIEKITEGFEIFYTTFGGEKLAKSLNQPQHIGIKENFFFTDVCKVVASRTCLLSPGQEAHLKISLKKKQLLSTAYQMNAYYVGQSNENVSTYSPVVVKKGAFFIIFTTQGGLAISGDADTTNVLTQETRLLIHYNQHFKAVMLNRQGNKRKYKFETEEMASTTDAGQLDINLDNPVAF